VYHYCALLATLFLMEIVESWVEITSLAVRIWPTPWTGAEPEVALCLMLIKLRVEVCYAL
jgi:hypothetical protein